VELIFKSSPFGTQSHGYEAQNSFLLYAFGERLLIRSGRRDIHGSVHHREWMWHTKSTNSITVNGESQVRHSASATGEIVLFHTSEPFDYVAGEAGHAYGDKLKQFTRRMLFVKPELIVIFDSLEAPEPSVFDWWLHSPTEMVVNNQSDIQVTNRGAACRVSLLAPEGLRLSLTNKFDPPPRPRIRLVEWHLKAQTAEPAKRMEFVTVIRPHLAGESPLPLASFRQADNEYTLEAKLTSGSVVVRMGGEPELAAVRLDEKGKPTEYLGIVGNEVQAGSGKELFRLFQ
jgi:hypothetical protein